MPWPTPSGKTPVLVTSFSGQIMTEEMRHGAQIYTALSYQAPGVGDLTVSKLINKS